MRTAIEQLKSDLASLKRKEQRAYELIGEEQQEIQALKKTIDESWARINELVTDKSELRELLQTQAAIRNTEASIAEIDQIEA